MLPHVSIISVCALDENLPEFHKLEFDENRNPFLFPHAVVYRNSTCVPMGRTHIDYK